MIDPTSLPYRPAAAIMLLNRQNQVWVGQRRDTTLEAWQMPQGGLDEGEEPEAGALRELHEETGIAPHLVEMIAQSREALLYDLPEDLISKLWKGRYRGQRQYWFLGRFLGTDADVRIETAEPEFRAWRWVEAEELPRLIVPFKRALYEAILAEFRPIFP
jgi:putative (di)nucleoside polyphosphate hydrolase